MPQNDKTTILKLFITAVILIASIGEYDVQTPTEILNIVMYLVKRLHFIRDYRKPEM
jgi:hypothetical protein